MKNEIINDLLGFEGLKIVQCPDSFNFSLDSTLLASFVSVNLKDKRIIDLGTGNAPIPLFLSMRTKAEIIGVEIQADIAELAKKSVEINGLGNQITILNDDAIGIYKKLGVSRFDLVTCNPPYFKIHENANTNKNEYLTIARHEVKMNLDILLQEVSRLLKDGGTFAMVHRSARLLDILIAFRKWGIEPKRIRFVYPKKTSESSLILLIEGKKSSKTGELKILKPLYIHNLNNDYTKEVKDIFNYNKPMKK